MLLSRENKPKKLKIIREVREPDGRIAVRSEIISNTQVVEAYIRVRTTKDEQFIREYSHKDEEYKEEKRKEKRRLQDQLRRIKRNEERQKAGLAPKKQASQAKPKPIKESLQRMKCSACQGTGHMKTNKNCPLYGKQPPSEMKIGDILGAHKNDQQTNAPGELTEVEGTRVKIKTSWRNKPSLKFTIPKEVLKTVPHQSEEENKANTTTPEVDSPMGEDKRIIRIKQGKIQSQKRRSTMEEVDYFPAPHKSVQRRRADPKVSMSTLLGEIYQELKMVKGADVFMYPVNTKQFPDYLNVVREPMDMQQIHNNILAYRYELRKQFLLDVKKMLDNSVLYNGQDHDFTKVASTMFTLASDKINANEDKFIELEKAINPLLHEDDMVGFCFILKDIVESCKNIPKSAAFHTKVDPKKFPQYYEKIKNPMHFGVIFQKIKEQQYLTVGQFRKDVQLVSYF